MSVGLTLLRRRFKQLKVARSQGGCVSPTNLEAATALAIPQLRNLPQELAIIQESAGRRVARRGHNTVVSNTNLIDDDDPVARAQ